MSANFIQNKGTGRVAHMNLAVGETKGRKRRGGCECARITPVRDGEEEGR